MRPLTQNTEAPKTLVLTGTYDAQAHTFLASLKGEDTLTVTNTLAYKKVERKIKVRGKDAIAVSYRVGTVPSFSISSYEENMEIVNASSCPTLIRDRIWDGKRSPIRAVSDLKRFLDRSFRLETVGATERTNTTQTPQGFNTPKVFVGKKRREVAFA